MRCTTNLGAQFQGVRNTDDGTLYCEEALARITVNGTYARAAEFIPTAEQGGLIREIDRRMLGLVLDRLDEPSTARLSLNVSAASLGDPNTLALLRKRAPSTGYRRRLILETRESDLFADAARAERWAEGVRELGALVAIDDFTAARSALARIASFRSTSSRSAPTRSPPSPTPHSGRASAISPRLPATVPSPSSRRESRTPGPSSCSRTSASASPSGS
jgi:EAL domain-containing protein (putative c-di-GMP-specific phosphodiesterase class I)